MFHQINEDSILLWVALHGCAMCSAAASRTPSGTGAVRSISM